MKSVFILIGAATGTVSGRKGVGVLIQVLNMQCVSDLTGKQRHVRFISRLQPPD